MEWLQKIYITILNPFCGFSEKISETTRKRAIYVVTFLLYATCYVWYSIIGTGHPLTLLSRMLESIVLIILLIFLGLEKSLKPVKWNPVIIGLWFALGMLILVMGFFTKQNIGYWMTGPVIALGLPCFYMVYGREEKYEMLFDAVCKAAMICTITYFFLCLGGEFWNDNTWVTGRYNGLTIDANKIGELCLSSFCCSIYYLLVGNSKLWRALNVITLGIILGQTYLTQSRTTILAMGLIVIFYIVILLKDVVNLKRIQILIYKLTPLVLAVLLGIGCINIIHFVKERHQIELQAVRVEQEHQDGNEVRTTGENTINKQSKEEYRKMLPEKGENIDSFSSGRAHIWKAYAIGFNFIGNDADAATPISTAVSQRTAHNSQIEITYRSGYITGMVYFLLVLLTGIYLIRVMLRNNKKNKKGDYFMAITSIGYIIFTNLMSSFNPLTAIIFLLYAIAFPVLLGSSWRVKKKQNVN